MPATTSLLFEDLDAYAAAIRAGALSGLLAADAGRFEARLTRLDLRGLRLLAGRERLGRIAFLDVPANTVLIALPAVSHNGLLWAGVPIGSDGLLTVGPGSAMHARATGPCRWGEIRISVPTLARYGRALMGGSFRIPHGVRLWHPSWPLLDALAHLHTAAIRHAQCRPDGPLAAEAGHGLEQQLIEAVVDCLSNGASDRGPQRSDLMVRFEHLCQANYDQALRLTEVTARLGTSERTLRAHCDAHLGMGPHVYMQLHRLHGARRALRDALPESTIMQIAKAHGFTEPGRFASAYHALFGELPSVTLRDHPS